MSDNNTYTLLEEITVNGELFKTLTVQRRLRVKDRRRITAMHPDDPASAEVQGVADMCEVPFEVIDELTGDDYDALVEKISAAKKPMANGG